MTVRGVKELEAVLDTLVDKDFIKVQRAGLRDAAKPLIAAAKALAPYDEDDEDGYHLRDSIRTQIEPARSRQSEAQFRVGPARETASQADAYGRAGYAIKGGLGKSARAPNYAVIAEDSSPFMGPAFDATADLMVSTFRSRIEKRVNTIARKAAKAKAQ